MAYHPLLVPAHRRNADAARPHHSGSNTASHHVPPCMPPLPGETPTPHPPLPPPRREGVPGLDAPVSHEGDPGPAAVVIGHAGPRAIQGASPRRRPAAPEACMSIITISRGSFSGGQALAERVAQRLGYSCLSREVLVEAAATYGVPESTLAQFF